MNMLPNHYIRIFESIPMGIVAFDQLGHLMAMNQNAKFLLNIEEQHDGIEHFHDILKELSLSPKDLLANSNLQKTIRIKSNDEDKTLELTYGPLTGDKDTLHGFVIAIKDVTELEKKRVQDSKKDKDTFVGKLSADMAHEIRNPLGSIELLASLIRKESQRKKDVHRANQIIAAVKTVENRISQLVDYANSHQTSTTYVNIHSVLKDILRFSEKVIDGDRVVLSAQYADVEPIVECNPDMIKQAFLIIILNALQESSRLDIVTNHLNENRLIEISFIEKNTDALLHYQPDRMKGPQVTKEKKWGIGLAIVHHIVNMFKGYVRVEFLEKTGTSFVLSFPLAGR
jgi:nitrogen-specific signal transduction histidine kinase